MTDSHRHERTMVDTDRTRELRLAMVNDLVDRGEIRSAAWRSAFETVPRHLFVPRFHRWPQGERVLVDSSKAEDCERWLAAVYRDQPLFTQWDDDDLAIRSSSSAPSVMARMLEVLNVERGLSVLEIGTGTGYNAALLSERLGSHLVTTVDVDPQLVEPARERLERAGYVPTVAVADGFFGCSARAPYDRVIATCETLLIPSAWVGQTRPGGLILAIVAGAKALLVVGKGGSASGRFRPDGVRFMSMRGHGFDVPSYAGVELLGDESTRAVGTSFLDEEETSDYWFLFELLVAPQAMRTELGDDLSGTEAVQLVDQRDLSWFRLDLTTAQVTQGGPRLLWNAAEALYQDWCCLGRPDRDRFGLTVSHDGRHEVWLDDPTAGQRWELPTTRSVDEQVGSSSPPPGRRGP